MIVKELEEIKERLARIEARLADGLCEDVQDHELRIRWLERGFWIAFGALAALQVLLKFLPLPWR